MSSASALRLGRAWPLLYWAPTGMVLLHYFYTPQVITGRSMQPTLNPDSSQLWRDVGLFDRFSIHTRHSFNRGDIVSLRSPVDPRRMLVKRIVGLEGDFVLPRGPYPEDAVRVPEGHAWVEGDEGFHSDDSTRFGPVPLALVDSKLVMLLWPWSRTGLLDQPNFTKDGTPMRREDMAALERERNRQMRVTRASKTYNPS
ncbi:LexA/Signal peptidase [Pluteus cervinus]|uniref:LexA/Signal peptidase n=1 Tax=Pluteus cervinus TaxID=181527 RepID=A0ACD3BG82_9AGAR|nr:LexA/Signal peptidase [Pluteus cervinus]